MEARVEHITTLYLRYLRRDARADPRRVWARLARHRRWRPRYRGAVARAVAARLRDLGAPDEWLPPATAADEGRRTCRFEAPRSARDPTFDLHDCLPRPVRRRRGGAGRGRYRLLHDLGVDLADRLRSVSKAALRDHLGLLDRVLPAAVEDRATLRGWTADDWLDAYEQAYPGARCLSFGLFKTHLRTLNLAHGCCGARGGATLPVPVVGGRVAGPAPAPLRFGTSGSSAVDDEADRRRQALRTRVAELRARLCRPSGGGDDRTYAFSCAEGHRILEAAATDCERLVVLLLFSTGLRLGGLARLCVDVAEGAHAADVPLEACTTEKNGVPRRVQLSHACRILVARWWNGERRRRRAPPASRYLFPAVASEGAAPTRWLWSVCRAVFDRAGLRGPHVHPHTFRHTVVQLLYLAGDLSFETIGKWIGHRSVSVTSGVYGRLRQEDLQTRIRGVPFLEHDADRSDERRRQWQRLAEAIRAPPYTDLPEAEWADLRRAPGRECGRERDRAALLAAATRCAMRHVGASTSPTP